jgi:N-acetylmuramate 1-kinase
MSIFTDEIGERIQAKLELLGYSQRFNLVGSAGSARCYYRNQNEKGSVILMDTEELDADFFRFVRISNYLEKKGVNVPQIHCIDENSSQMLIEDLGDNTLLQVVQNDRDQIKIVYPIVLDSLAQLQKSSLEDESVHGDVQLNQALENRNFGLLDIRWETEYFSHEFLSGYLGVKPNLIEDLIPYFDELANKVSDHSRGFMHRDFQSQNLMIKDFRLFQIDFQGARNGSIYYDLASVLWDPYVELSLKEVEFYFESYCSKVGWNKREAWSLFLQASLQRLMQALGAYAFLSLKKGKVEFKNWVAPGLRQLRQVLEISDWEGRELLFEIWE